MVYCPDAIMNSISSNPLNNHAPNANDRHHHQVLVRFPSLPPSNSNPTDSEGTEEHHAPAAAAADGGLTSSVYSGKSSSSSTSSSSSSTAAAASDVMDGDYRPSCSTKKRKASTTAANNNDATKPKHPVGQQPRKLKLPVVPDLIGLSDPSAKMKLYLNELVSFVKVQKEIEQKRDEDGQQHSSGEMKEEGGKKRKISKLDQQDDDGEELTAVTSSISSEQVSVIDEKAMSSKEPIETVMHWMDSFQDDEMIQQLCLQSLPSILENPILRRTAQSDGLASIVLYDMAAFPSNSLLILTAFHTLVVLLRPLGTNEGMVHKASAVSRSQRGTAAAVNCTTTASKGIRSISKKRGTRGEVAADATGGDATATTAATAAINSINFKGGVKQHPSAKQQKPRSDSTSSSSLSSVLSNSQLHDPSVSDQLTNWEENGVRVMLDSLRRYSNDRYLQAMGCWAMVNAALYPSLKSSLTKLGGVYAVTNAMMLHPNAEAVQFRGLFALINLVIPERDNGSKNEPRSGGSSIQSHVYQIARLTILAMKNFHTNKSILNRGCLVLRNLSLTPSFVKILGRTPGCVDMLLHCRQSCPRDVLVQRSARTIMLMIQTSTEKEHDRNSFELTRPFPVPSQERAGSSSAPSSSDVTKDR